MTVTRTRVGVLIAILFWTFGCKGAGGAFKVLGAAAVVATRVAAVAIAESAARSGHGSESREEGEPASAGEYVVQAPEPEADPEALTPASAPASAPARCVELTAAPELPGDSQTVRSLACGRHVIVQDPATGLWREHR